MSTVQELLLKVGGDGKEAEGMFNSLSDGILGMINPTALVTGAILGIGAALVGLGTYGVLAADDVKHAMNTLQTQTGATDKEMAGLEEALLEIYEGNYGESYEDIAESMAKVKQNSKALGIQSTKDLKEMTKNAIVLRDAFGFEVDETVRATTSLMTSFGLKGEEAYNLIAQGAQKGLNKNGDMLDIINEYSPQFKALGFTSEQFFDTLVSGANSGEWSIDKLGDAVKEFNIRAKDGSDTTKQAFKDLGFDADDLTDKFAKGGKTAKQAYEEVNKKLLAMKDPVKQNQIGVALWGTMWEDLEKKGIKSLVNVKSEVDKTKDSLKEIDNIKYDTFGEALAGLKRVFDVNVAVPIGKVILPILGELVKGFMRISGAISENLGPLLGEIKTKLQEAFGGSLPSIESLVDIIVNQIPGAFDIIETIVLPALDRMIQFIKNLGSASDINLKQGLIDVIKMEGPNIVQSISEMGDSFVKFWDALVEFSETEAAKTIMEALILLSVSGAQSFLFLAEATIDFIKIVYKLLTNAVQTFSVISDAFEIMQKSLVVGFALLRVKIPEAWNYIKSKIGSVVNAVKSGLSSFGSWITTSVPNAFSRAVSYAKSKWNGLVSGISSIAGKVKSAVKSVIDGGINYIKGLSLYSSGTKLIQTFINGIKGMASSAWKAVKDLVQGIRNKLPFSPAKEGPLSDLDKTGPAFIQTILKGIKKKTPELNAAIQNVVEKMNIQNVIPSQNLNVSNGISRGGMVTVNINEPHIFNDKDVDYLFDKMKFKLQGLNIQPERR